MTSQMTPGVVAGRLAKDVIDDNFADLHAPLDGHEAMVAADRCYFCHDAPCITACPTDIDIPLFIRQIASGTPEAAAKTDTSAVSSSKMRADASIDGPRPTRASPAVISLSVISRARTTRSAPRRAAAATSALLATHVCVLK